MIRAKRELTEMSTTAAAVIHVMGTQVNMMAAAIARRRR